MLTNQVIEKSKITSAFFYYGNPKYVICRAKYEPPTAYRRFFGSGWNVRIKCYVPYLTQKNRWIWAAYSQIVHKHDNSDDAISEAKKYKANSLHCKELVHGLAEEYMLSFSKETPFPVLADWFEENSFTFEAEFVRLVEATNLSSYYKNFFV